MVIVGITTTQVGAGVAKHLFHALGPGGTVFLRVGFAALLLFALWRPRFEARPRRDYVTTVLFGLALAAMNLSFYMALNRIPLGIAVTLEFVGPLGVAVAGSRRAIDFLWAALAGCGIILLAPWGGLRLDLAGIALALAAGACWASYILLSARVGRSFPGGSGLALAMGFATLVLLPVGLVSAGSGLLDPRLLLVGAGVAILSSMIPYSLELEALRRLPTRVFGVLMSLEPAIAALVGFVILREGLGARALIAMGLVILASLGSSRSVVSEPTG